MVNERKLIALCTSRVYDPQIFGFVQTLNQKVQEGGGALLIFTINSDIYWQEDDEPAETYVFDIMPYDELDCIVIMNEKIKSHRISNRIIDKAKAANVPVVVVDGKYEDTIKVNFDYAAGFEKICAHVIEEHGVKDPHMMAGFPDNVFSNEREDVFKKVLERNGIPFDKSRVSYGGFWADPTKKAMKELLKREKLPDAIICANDIMALNVCDILKHEGYKVPEDVLVSGFDGIEEVYYSSPKIATASCDVLSMAKTTAEVVSKILKGEEAQNELIVPELVTNESCGCPARTQNTLNQMASFNNSVYRYQDDTRILYNISSNMETSSTLLEMAANIHNHKTKYSLTVVDKNIFDSSSNYFMTDEGEKKKTDFHMINDADYAEEHRFEKVPLPMSVFYDNTVNEKENVLSGNYRKRILELMESGYPLIFNALDYMNHAFGFNCYYYKDFTITDYSRTSIVTNGISMGIGGFVNLQYQRSLLEKMDEMYIHDSLTGLYNRLGFLKVYEEVKARKENKGNPVTVIMSDLDGLKYINDNFGHANGDISITAVANALRAACPENALCARFGGDEIFTVIFGECDSDDIIRKINEYLVNYNAQANLPYRISTSSGAVTSTYGPEYDLNVALKIADERMYAVKSAKYKSADWHR